MALEEAIGLFLSLLMKLERNKMLNKYLDISMI